VDGGGSKTKKGPSTDGLFKELQEGGKRKGTIEKAVGTAGQTGRGQGEAKFKCHKGSISLFVRCPVRKVGGRPQARTLKCPMKVFDSWMGGKGRTGRRSGRGAEKWEKKPAPKGKGSSKPNE